MRQVRTYGFVGTKSDLERLNLVRSKLGCAYQTRESHMFRNFFITALTTTFLTATTPVLAETMVKEVAVTADLTAVQNQKAAEHWATLADDLKNAITAAIVDRIADDGVKISVTIDSVELANSFQSATGVAESKLVGSVNVTDQTDNSKFNSYELTVSFAQAGPFFLPGTDLTKITSDSKEYYDAMVAAFADAVAKSLK